MSRYIDADAIDYDFYWNTKGYSIQECQRAEQLVNEQPTADVPQWIPCSDERLPKEDMRVIVQYGDGSLGVIERVRLKFWNIINSPYAKVVAWMPLPKPWRGEEDG